MPNKRKILLFIACYAAMQAAQAQLRDVANRAFDNPAAMMEYAETSITLLGQNRLYGFDGAPIEAALYIAVPFATGTTTQYDDFKNMYAGIRLEGTSIGAYRQYDGLLSYAYHLRLSETSTLGLGVSIGAKMQGRNYASLLSGSGEQDPAALGSSKSRWAFASQVGAFLESKNFYAALYSPDVLSVSVMAGGGFRSAFGGNEDEGAYSSDGSKKRSKFEVNAAIGYGPQDLERRGLAAQASMLFTIRGLLGVGAAWRYPQDVGALLTLGISRVKVGYCYRLANLNPVLPAHELMVNLSIGKRSEF